MSWIKDFRKARGLSQVQLAQFAGISRPYLSILEGRQVLPPELNALFRELELVFTLADAETDYSALVSPPQKFMGFQSELQLRLEKKQEQLQSFRNQLATLEERYRHLLLLRKVCAQWRVLKTGIDPALPAKINAIEASQKTELRRCGPMARAKIRIKIARLEAETEIISEEFKFFLSQSVS
jgi:transcriptional regulator with XRE-family HTH domain